MATDASPKLQDPVPQTHDFDQRTATAEHDGLQFWQFMVAGSIAGMVEHMGMFPVDTVKTRMQALGTCPIKSASVKLALQSILKSDGPKGFYRGIGAMGLGAGPAHAVYFSVYEICKKSFSRGNPDNHAAHAVSGVCATVASDAVLTPMDMVKQRLQLGSSPYKGLWQCVQTVFREEGIRAFYASYLTTILMNAPYTAVHFSTYESTKRGLTKVSPDSADEETLMVHATAGAVAGASAAALTTPLDVVKTQLQCQGVCGCDRFANGSIKDVVRTIITKDGYRGLMRGWMPRMLFHAPAAAICWSTYEAAKTFFQELNNGRSSERTLTVVANEANRGRSMQVARQ
ncbi:uncharacterized protein LOC127253868 isoform X2 [Andrographis paniculata]|uniref:uncharacterized protein LOC127253868 isoform X2 n=1 Tax=Andrographis paniculata TaxID=175694 RepID=UPI0021E827B3|nr:uncharacterized protein LOC127253868 isoform X2 [Andrographis paniculata]